MDLVSPNWTLVMTAISIVACVGTALIALWAGKAFAAADLSRLRFMKRLALVLGFTVGEAVSPAISGTAIRRVRLRLACLLLTVVICLVGYQWLARKTDEATAEWLNGIRSRHEQHRYTHVHRTSKVRDAATDKDHERP
jgi:hypothetical protein